VGTVLDFMRRVGSATGQGLLVAFEAIGELPVHCFRCQREFKFRDGELKLLLDIPPHRNTLHQFCRECAAVICAEYAYRCGRCGDRHNLAESRICANCQALRYPREAKRVQEHNMRAWELGLPATLTVPEWLRTLKDWNWSCWCCGEPFEALDHLIPIALGGGTTAENCFPICRRCNSMKGAFHPDALLQPSPRSPESHRRLQVYQTARWPQSRATTLALPANLLLPPGERSDN
jgi:5-methylcytosine-specific restriction endonuclease McrA